MQSFKAQKSSSFPFRLAAIDLDDTLLGPDKQISAANAAAVSTLRSQEVRVILASGRRHENMLRFHQQLGLEGPIISSQGALVKDAETSEILHQYPVPAALAAEVVAEGIARGMTLIYYHSDGVYVSEKNKWTELYQSRTGDAPTVYGDLTILASETPQKIIWCDAPSRIAALLPQMQARYEKRLYVVTTDPEFLEFIAVGVNKAVGVATVAKRYGIESSQVLAFGDGNNDVAMLKWAGLGMAMSNARPSAKAAAALISPPGDPETSFARAVAALMMR